MLDALDIPEASALCAGRATAAERSSSRDGIKPAPGETLVWSLDLRLAEEDAKIKAARDILSRDEAARAGRFRFSRDERRFVLTRATLRRVLAALTGRDASTIAFRYGEAGKPELAHCHDVAFSVSHSGDLALIAVAARDRASFELGIDIEAYRPVPELLAIAKRYFAPEEAKRLALLDPSERDAAFLNLWVMKEACVKARGRGLAALEELNALVSSGTPLPWSVTPLDVHPCFAAAIAHAPRPHKIRLQTAAPFIDQHD